MSAGFLPFNTSTITFAVSTPIWYWSTPKPKTPPSATIVSAEGKTPILNLSVTLTTVAIALAIVLSIGTNIASTSLAKLSVTCWISLVFAIEANLTSIPNSAAYFLASSICFIELSSLEVYKRPTFLRLGKISFISSSCCLIGVLSLTPVILFPGLSSLAISPASTG